MVRSTRLGLYQPYGHCNALSTGEIVMRLLSKKQVKELVLYSVTHIDRLEKTGKFPKRVRLGTHRIGYVESEIIEWLEEKICERDKPTDTP